MKEKITEDMLRRWYKDFPVRKPAASVSVRSLTIVIESGMIAAKDAKGSGISFVKPSDVGIDWKISRGALLLHAPSRDEDFIYVLDPGSKKVVRLDLYFEGDYFCFYSKDYPLPFPLSKDFCASAYKENLLVVDSRQKKYVFINKKDERVSAALKVKECLGCAVLGGDGGIACDENKIFLFLNGERAEIELGEITEEKLRAPVFGAGKSKNFFWAAVKDKDWNFSVLISVNGKEKFSYTRFPLNELKGRTLL